MIPPAAFALSISSSKNVAFPVTVRSVSYTHLDQHAKSGISNREIWRRYIYPVYAITERTFYNILNASAESKNKIADDTRQLLLFEAPPDLPKGEEKPLPLPLPEREGSD